MEWLGATEPIFTVIGLITVVVLVVAVVVGLIVASLQTGRSSGCDRHEWSSGPTSSTRAWKWRSRTLWHRLRWHSLPGQQPLYATDDWIAKNGDALLQMRDNRGPLRRPRVQRAIQMAQAAVRDKAA